MSGFGGALAKVQKKLFDTISKMKMRVRGIPIKNVEVDGIIRIKGKPCKCTIGSNLKIVSNMWSNPLGGGHRTIFSFGPEAHIVIGDNVGISNSCFRIRKGITIGNNVNIGGDCKFYDSDMHSIEYEYRISCPDTHIKIEPIIIDEGAWIGAHSIILKGIRIGKRSVVGAGSVITRSIPDDEIWAGNPAKFIRKINMEKNDE